MNENVGVIGSIGYAVLALPSVILVDVISPAVISSNNEHYQAPFYAGLPVRFQHKVIGL